MDVSQVGHLAHGDTLTWWSCSLPFWPPGSAVARCLGNTRGRWWPGLTAFQRTTAPAQAHHPFLGTRRWGPSDLASSSAPVLGFSESHPHPEVKPLQLGQGRLFSPLTSHPTPHGWLAVMTASLLPEPQPHPTQRVHLHCQGARWVTHPKTHRH